MYIHQSLTLSSVIHLFSGLVYKFLLLKINCVTLLFRMKYLVVLKDCLTDGLTD